MLAVEFLKAVLKRFTVRPDEVLAVEGDWNSGLVARHDLSVCYSSWHVNDGSCPHERGLGWTIDGSCWLGIHEIHSQVNDCRTLYGESCRGLVLC